jgi:hypothetical protein
MSELRVVALSERSQDSSITQALRFVLQQAPRSYYAGKTQVSASRSDVHLYAEIVYLLNVLVEQGDKEGRSGRFHLFELLEVLKASLPDTRYQSTSFHAERFEKIQKEEDEEYREQLTLLYKDKDYDPARALLNRD